MAKQTKPVKTIKRAATAKRIAKPQKEKGSTEETKAVVATAATTTATDKTAENQGEAISASIARARKSGRYIVFVSWVEGKKINTNGHWQKFPLDDIATARKQVEEQFGEIK
ncbi:hypothetical protein [Trichococcus shcherbakoviae]|uniref:hypothetical protein n=1 Tax=Trichococcus shcherbakoviae TaxID=2094020 RepID=UPI002AA88489|nr:hypothetical protein [Trichococcus shcherbakoviae]